MSFVSGGQGLRGRGCPTLSVDEYVGASLCALRLEAGYSRPELANILQISRDDLAAIEAGHKRPSTDTLMAFSDVLETSAADLMAEYFEFVGFSEMHSQSASQRFTNNVIYLDQQRR